MSEGFHPSEEPSRWFAEQMLKEFRGEFTVEEVQAAEKSLLKREKDIIIAQNKFRLERVRERRKLINSAYVDEIIETLSQGDIQND